MARTRNGGGTSTREYATPWGTELVPGVEPLEVRIGPNSPARIEGAALALRVGLPGQLGPKGWPVPGDLAGLVVQSDVQATAYVCPAAWAYTKLRAHRFTGVSCDAGSHLSLSAVSHAGMVRVWPCVGIEPKQRAPFTMPESGPARRVLMAASAATEEAPS